MHEAQFQKWEKKHGVKTEHVYISDFEDSLKRLCFPRKHPIGEKQEYRQLF